MTMRGDLVSYLESFAGLIPLVGERIYPSTGVTEEGTDYITYETLSNPSSHNFDSADEIGMETIIFNCWARNATTPYTIAEQVRLALDGYTGQMGATFIKGAFLQNMIDTTEPVSDGSQEYWYRRGVIVKFNYTRDIPAFSYHDFL